MQIHVAAERGDSFNQSIMGTCVGECSLFVLEWEGGFDTTLAKSLQNICVSYMVEDKETLFIFT